MENLSREERRALRRRGKSNRQTDTTDLVLRLPAETPVLTQELHNKITTRVNEQDKYNVRDYVAQEQRIEQPGELQQVPRDLYVVSKAKIIQKHSHLTSLRRLNRRRIYQSTRLSKREQPTRSKSKHVRAQLGKLGIKMKYQRMPKQRYKLVTLDILSQIVQDYFKSNDLATQMGRILVADLEENRGKAKGGKKKTKSEEVPDKSFIRSQIKTLFKNYLSRLSSYFNSLIDTQLTIQLVKSDLQQVNIQKDEIRSKLALMQQDNSQLNHQLELLRDEVSHLRRNFSFGKGLVSSIEQVKHSSTENLGLVQRVNWKLAKVSNESTVAFGEDTKEDILLRRLRAFNDKLEAQLKK